MVKQGKMGDIVFSSKEMKEALKAAADGGELNYVGINDDLVDFGDAESFIDESEGNKEFTIRMVNNTNATQKVQFNKILEDVTGYNLLKEGAVATVGNDTLDANGDPRSIDVLLAYIEKAPTRVRSIKINVSNEGQLDEPLKYQEENAFMTASTKQKVPSTFQDQNTNNTKTVEVELKDWILGYRSTILYSIRAGVTVSMTFCFGGSLDNSKALAKKHKRATNTAAKFFARQNA